MGWVANVTACSSLKAYILPSLPLRFHWAANLATWLRRDWDVHRAAASSLPCAGFPDYGMRVNPAKTRVTFDLRPGPHVRSLPRNTVFDGCNNEFVPWCALSTAEQ